MPDAGADAQDLEPEPGATRIRSVARAAQLLTLIAAAEDGASAKQLSALLGTTLPTTYHLLNTLADTHLITRDENRVYRLGHGMEELASAYYRQSAPSPALLGPLSRLIETTGETAYYSAWRRGALEILAVRSGTHAVRVMNLQPGFHGDAHARASGKLLLALGRPETREAYLAEHPLVPVTKNTIVDADELDAELEAIRRRGFASDEEEFAEGVCCLAVPVYEGDALIGAYTLSAPSQRYREHKFEYLAHLKAAAAAATGSDPLAPELAS